MENSARNWVEYISAGKDEAGVMNAWIKNHAKFNLSSSYWDWVKWYKESVSTLWNGQDRSPAEVISILEDSEEQGFAEKAKSYLTNLFSQKKEPVAQQYTPIKANNAINIDNLSAETKLFIQYMYEVADKLNLPKPVITSGYRSSYGQVKAMANNWNAHGGLSGGREYFLNLYSNDKMALEVSNVFEMYGTGRDALLIAEKVFSKYSQQGAHTRNPAIGLDLKLTKGIDKILNYIKNDGSFNLKTLFEENHWHVEVR